MYGKWKIAITGRVSNKYEFGDEDPFPNMYGKCVWQRNLSFFFSYKEWSWFRKWKFQFDGKGFHFRASRLASWLYTFPVCRKYSLRQTGTVSLSTIWRVWRNSLSRLFFRQTGALIPNIHFRVCRKRWVRQRGRPLPNHTFSVWRKAYVKLKFWQTRTLQLKNLTFVVRWINSY